MNLLQSNVASDRATTLENVRPRSQSLKSMQNGSSSHPPPTTEKPKPHICTTCDRRFARLEHLKRHERSHTKEKPFECPECARCFARRDLLLRHQQKLHMTTTPASRPRGGRRESTSSNLTAGGKIKKSALGPHGALAQGNQMRPRANTIGHVDDNARGDFLSSQASARHAINVAHSRHPSLAGFAGPGQPYRGMSSTMGNHGPMHALPKLDTNDLSMNLAGSLHTAPAFGGFDGFGMGMALEPGDTVNPAQLHFPDSPTGMHFDPSLPAYVGDYSGMPSGQVMMDAEGNFEWVNAFDNPMAMNFAHEHAISASSPSAMSTDSPGGMHEALHDSGELPSSTTMWQHGVPAPAPPTPGYGIEMTPFNMQDFHSGLLSPANIIDHFAGAPYLPAPMAHPQASMVSMVESNVSYAPSGMATSESPNAFDESLASSYRQSSVTSSANDLITEATRQALLTSLAQPSAWGLSHRKYPAQAVHPPLAPGLVDARTSPPFALPSASDLQRYVTAYIQCFHPHFPFLHISTLSFDAPSQGSSNIQGGGGSLILAMAAIGALYEYDHAVSKELFDHSKTLMQHYLEERRQAEMRKAELASLNAHHQADQVGPTTPLWLVQAMLLNVVYGHNCGDKTSADIASTHCAALVSLSRAAGLAHPTPAAASHPSAHSSQESPRRTGEPWTSQEPWARHAAWLSWKAEEERKRTLYAIFILSSMLVSAYNHAPALTNAEIKLDLPCADELWHADSADSWHALRAVDPAPIAFPVALGALLNASNQAIASDETRPPAAFTASAFACLALINALHNVVWEARQRHLGAPWSARDTNALCARVMPALGAWEAVWARHSPHILGQVDSWSAGNASDPLAADCLPLLELAYVRLYVSLGRAKEASWARDFDTMANELARGHEFAFDADDSRLTDPSHHLEASSYAANGMSANYEFHLRRAAEYAMRSLEAADARGLGVVERSSPALPLQAALCAADCAQVLAEWVAAVQMRVGRRLGLLGVDVVTFMPAWDEGEAALWGMGEGDVELLRRIGAWVTRVGEQVGSESVGGGGSREWNGWGSRVLMVVATMLDGAAVWPVTHLMARSLETQAAHVAARAAASVLAID